MKTRQPMIVTARIEEHDLIPFTLLRRTHFLLDRHCLPAHLTMFYRLPGEHVDKIIERLRVSGTAKCAISARVSGIRHLGSGVAFSIEAPQLSAIRTALRQHFIQWLGSQDMQAWQPHITVQNKASRAEADRLYRELTESFRAQPIKIVGLDLWRYLNGPWAREASVLMGDQPALIARP